MELVLFYTLATSALDGYKVLSNTDFLKWQEGRMCDSVMLRLQLFVIQELLKVCRDAEMYELMIMVCVNFSQLGYNLCKIIHCFAEKGRNFTILCCSGNTYGCEFVSEIRFIFERCNTKSTHMCVVLIYVWQSHFVQSSTILYPVFILHYCVANSLFFPLQFTHFFG